MDNSSTMQMDDKDFKNKKLEYVSRRISILRELCTMAEAEMISLMRDELGANDELGCVIGYSGCNKSPLNICVYDHKEDKDHKSCMFCHKPETENEL